MFAQSAMSRGTEEDGESEQNKLICGVNKGMSVWQVCNDTLLLH